jgi:hypothetical protein
MSKYFSIAIPTYEMNGQGSTFLDFSFQKLNDQVFKNFEIVISDHSISDEIKDLCTKWSDILDIKYVRNTNKIGSSSANVNNAIRNCTGEWIKILFQDDFLFDYESLSKISDFISSSPNSEWIATSCEHSNDGQDMYRPFYPKWDDNIHFGKNTISSPSVICIKNKTNKLYFDEDLIWLMDVEYYKRMYDSYGEPSYIYDIIVVNRTWGNQLTNTIGDEVKSKEKAIIKSRYNEMNLTEQIFDNLCKLKFDHNTLYSRGIVDINEHLPTLREYASHCDHVTEMGTRFAISTFALLMGRPKKVVSIDMNYHFFKPFESEINDFANQCGTPFQFIEADVLKIDIEKTDMLFIDTLHTYNQLSKELRRHEKNVSKWIILHDTITFGQTNEEFYQNGVISDEISNQFVEKRGLYTALIDFLEENRNWKIKEHFTNNNGLTIIERC